MAASNLFVDTDAFAKLGRIARLDVLLRPGLTVYVTSTVMKELSDAPLGAIGAQTALAWIEQQKLAGTLVVQRGEPKFTGSGAGEKSIVVTADEIKLIDPSFKALIVTDNVSDIINPNSPLFGRSDVSVTRDFSSQLVVSGQLSVAEYAQLKTQSH